MKERPILFKGPLVRAILEDRKSVTRRVLNPQPDFVGGRGEEDDYTKYGWADENGAWSLLNLDARLYPGKSHTTNSEEYASVCPHGQAGDQLYVRESWNTECVYDDLSPSEIVAMLDIEGGRVPIWYAATDHDLDEEIGRGRPSIHMPRAFSRIDLEIMSVRAERVQDITVEDIAAEGVDLSNLEGEHPPHLEVVARARWENLWDKTNAHRADGAYRWDANPFVWRIEFRRLQPT